MSINNLSALIAEASRLEKLNDVVLTKNTEKIISSLKITILIILIIVGVFGNTLNMVVFGKKKMRRVSTFRYLFFLSIVDLTVLSTAVLHLVLKEFVFDIRLYSGLSCKIHTFSKYLK